MRSCEMYQESVTDLLKLLQDSRGTAMTDQCTKRICEQVQDDTLLMKEIIDETNSISKSTAKHSQIRNAFTTLFTGRLEKIKELESELLSRVHMISMEFIRIQVRISILVAGFHV